MNLIRGTTIALIYRHGIYGEPDWCQIARRAVLDQAIEDGLEPLVVNKHRVELNNLCRVVLLDETEQDRQSRGYMFDSVCLCPPAEIIGEGVKRSILPTRKVNDGNFDSE